jgi:hypothetical protein
LSSCCSIRRAKADGRDEEVYAALQVAAFWGQEAVVELMFENGAEIGRRGN